MIDEEMLRLSVFFLVILNPFAQVLYLADLMRDLTPGQMTRVHFTATALSFGVFALFALVGDLLLDRVFQVRLEALQIFGGLIMLFIAYRYVTVGPGSNLLFKGNIRDIAPNISLPYMVGPGTIWLAVLMGRTAPLAALVLIAGALAVNTVFILIVHRVFDKLQARKDTMLGKYFAILMRTNALLIGAIAVEMILLGIDGTLLDPAAESPIVP